MSKIVKSIVTVDGNAVRMSMPFAKVDQAKRTVSGFATLDNLDTQKDIVLSDASVRAFSRARGNIREMHQPLAVGRMVDFVEKEYYDNEDNKVYRGIYVTARVSEGAEDTWKKCLDGTLSGFSIGGEINKASNGFSKEAGMNVRFIEDYDLTELSLVDNPANQKANFDSIQKSVLSFTKSATGEVVAGGMAVETKIENVFVCAKHDNELISISECDTEVCPLCGDNMENAGWFESGDNKTEKVQTIVNDFLNPTADKEAAPISDSEGGGEMGVKKNEEKVEETGTEEVSGIEEAGTEEVPSEEVTEVEETEIEEAETPDEVHDEGEEISKKMDELREVITESLEKTRNETADTVSSLEAKVDEVKSEFVTKFSELEEKLNGFGNKLEASKSRLAELENALEKMNSADAVKKSADLNNEPAEKNLQKSSSWNGAFSGNSNKRFSVDNLT